MPDRTTVSADGPGGTARDAAPEALLRLFPGSGDGVAWRWIAPAEMPEPARGLLVHGEHMTLRLERAYGAPLRVRVLAARRDGETYARKVQIVAAPEGRIVQLAVVRVDLAVLPEAARASILAGAIPMGRALVAHVPERRIEVAGCVRLEPSCAMTAELGRAQPAPAFGRLVRIHIAGRPGIEALEIVSA